MIIDAIPANAKPIRGSPGYYVTPDGRVFSDKWSKPRLLEPANNGLGYQFVGLCGANGKRKFKYVHIIVAEEFLEKPEGATQVNHKNGLKTDNSVENLEWLTASQNQLHAYQNGLHIPPHCKAVKLIDIRTGNIETFQSTCECARRLGTNHGIICRAIQDGHVYKKQYRVEYAEPETLNKDRIEGFTTLEEYIDIPKY